MAVCLVEGQFKMIDSANFRTKKGVANSSNIAFVQINHFVDPLIAEQQQSRAFATIEQEETDDPNLIKVHIQYQPQSNKNDIHSAPHPKLLSSALDHDMALSSSSGFNSSSLHRIIASNKNRNSGEYFPKESNKLPPSSPPFPDKYNPGLRRKFKTRPRVVSRKELSHIGDPVQRDFIMKENQRILKKLQIKSTNKKDRPTKVGTFKSSCRCVTYGENCPKMQITVGRCKTHEMMCCF